MSKKFIISVIIVIVAFLVFDVYMTDIVIFGMPISSQKDSTMECPYGYTYTQVSSSNAESGYYCKRNITWYGLKRCNSDIDCNKDEGYYCRSRIDYERDYRCVPMRDYYMTCSCTPGKGCVCF